MINASFVFGLDGDDSTTFDRTVDWIVENKIETVTSHILTPYPGTAQHAEMEREGRITSHRLAEYTTSNVVFMPRRISPEHLKKGYLGVYRKVYSYTNIIRRIPSSHLTDYLLFNFVYRKWGNLTEKVCRIAGYRRVGNFCRMVARYR